jgi:ribosomal-protein-alanine N-acetyltransferase
MRERRVEVTPMVEADLEAVLEIEQHSYPAPWPRQIFVEELGREWAHLRVLRERQPDGSERVVGFCNYWLVRDEVHLLNLAVHPAARRKGHGRLLLRELLAFAAHHQCRYVTLEVRRSNLGAIHLYRAHGFEPVGVRQNYYVENREDAIVMLLTLPGLPGAET